MLERTRASERPLPTQGSLTIALTLSPGSDPVPGRSVLCWHYCCLTWHPVCSLCAVPEGGNRFPPSAQEPPELPSCFSCPTHML